MQDLDQPSARSFVIEEDINEAFENAYYPPKRTKKKWAALFHAKTYWNALGFKDLDDNKLSVRKLESHAIEASRIR